MGSLFQTFDRVPFTCFASSASKMNESASENDCEDVWASIKATAEKQVQTEPMLASFLHATVLNHRRFEDAVSYQLAGELDFGSLRGMQMRDIIDAAFENDSEIIDCIKADILAVRDRDPSVSCCLVPLLYLKGVHALTAYRVAHWLWGQDRKLLAAHIQNLMSIAFGVDIHPAARIGRGVFMDHATSIVIGETAVVADNVSMLHEVTLGGTGKESGDRHPKVHQNVLIGAGAKILGNVTIGEGAKIGAGSVVLTDVPAHCTFAGVPATNVGRPCNHNPSEAMDHQI